MDIWTACKERIAPESLRGELIRVVESQEQVATNSLVDNLQEQELLENLLESTKPASSSKNLHYLLHTPFRYPPLKHGSRFGLRTEPSLFYGSLTISTALAETAYYRLLFWQGMSIAPASGKFTTQHTAFTARYQTESGLKLHQPPFDTYLDLLRHPASYQATQAMGSTMRKNGIIAFEYISARDEEKGVNIALFNNKALSGQKPLSQQAWLCETNSEQVSFFSTLSKQTYHYPKTTFLINDHLPDPAT